MTNKTDKAIMEEFEERFTKTDYFGHRSLDEEKFKVYEDATNGDLKVVVGLKAFLKQALSRKEEEIKKKYEYARKETLLVLKELCKDFGDLDWNDDLHLADIIEKHLAKHLYNLKK